MFTSNTFPDLAHAGTQERWPLGRTCVSVGAAIYLASFFLPAVGDGSWIKGWECARIALLLAFAPPHVLSLLLLGSGLINPLVLVYFSLRVLGVGERIRRWIAIAAMTLIPLSWIFLALTHLEVGVGHVLWVGGLLLMLLPDVLRFVRRGRP
jgi:hypothetical protein